MMIWHSLELICLTRDNSYAKSLVQTSTQIQCRYACKSRENLYKLIDTADISAKSEKVMADNSLPPQLYLHNRYANWEDTN